MSIIECQLEGGATTPVDWGRERASCGSEYHRALSALTPLLRRIVGPAVQSEEADAWRRRTHLEQADGRLSELAAAQALAVHAGTTAPTDAGVRDQIRSALVRWQLSLLGDGRPVRSARSHVGHRAACAGFAARILAGGVSYETPIIISDLMRHLHWLWSRSGLPPWAEAALIDTACEAALVARESVWLQRARNRLGSVLQGQNAEGWFDRERHCGLLAQAFATDSLARAHVQTGWPELEQPLIRALNALSTFVRAPRCHVCPCAAIPFYAAEAMGNRLGHTVAIASASRCAARDLTALTPRGQLDIALAAGSMALAAGLPRLRQSPEVPVPHALADGAHSAHDVSEDDTRRDVQRLCGGILFRGGRDCEAWIDVHNGAAAVVRWLPSGTILEDSAFLVARGGTWRSVSRHPNPPVADHSVIHYRGEMRRGKPGLLDDREPGGSLVARWRKTQACGMHERDITIDVDQLVIRDVISLRRRADAAVFGAPGPADATGRPIVLGGVKHVELCRTYRDGRLMELRRKTR